MLKNAYLLAKIGADTAENERNFAKNWQLRLVLPKRPKVYKPLGTPAERAGTVVRQPKTADEREFLRKVSKEWIEENELNTTALQVVAMNNFFGFGNIREISQMLATTSTNDLISMLFSMFRIWSRSSDNISSNLKIELLSRTSIYLEHFYV